MLQFKKCYTLATILIIFLNLTACGGGGGSAPATTTIPVASNVQLLAADTQITLSWDAVATADSYVIYWDTAAGVSTSSTPISVNSPGYIHTGLTNGQAYYYKIQTVEAGDMSNLTAEFSASPNATTPPATAPAIPLNTQALSGDTQVTVSWDSVTNAASYKVYWNTNGNVSSNDTFIDAQANTQITHSGLSNGLTYYYRIAATNTAGESDLSAVASAAPASTPVGVPTSPQNLIITNGSGEITLSWNSVTIADTYTVYWKTGQGNVLSSDNVIDAGANTQITHTGLLPGKTYKYKVSASNTSGESFLSTQEQTTQSSSWQTINPAPQSNQINFIRWVGTQYIATGKKGTIITSVNGTDWNTKSAGTLYDLNGAATNGSLYVVVGNGGTILTSPDTTTWTQRRAIFTTQDLNDVIWDGTQFIVVGNSGKIVTSNDGITWINRVPVSDHLYAITQSDNLVVAVGNTGAIFTTTDGITWSKKTSTSTSKLHQIHWNGTQFVVVGAGNTILISTDGTNWTFDGFTEVNTLKAITWSGTQYVLTTLEGEIFSSADATSWTLASTPTTTSVNTIEYHAGQYIAAGIYGKVLTSSNAIDWTIQGANYETLYDIHWDGSQYIAVGDTTQLSSTDSLNWSARSSSLSYNAITSNGSRYVAVAGFGAVNYSTDGITWQGLIADSVGFNTLNDVIWADNQFVIVGAGGFISTSADGATWNNQSSGITTSLHAVSWNGTQYVAVGNSAILTSPDAVTWTPQTLPDSGSYRDIVWNGSLFVAVGSGAITSPDGATWVRQNAESSTLYAVTWNGSEFMAVGQIGVTTSSIDGTNWVEEITGTYNDLYGISWDGTNYLAVGLFGTILKK